MKFSRNQKLVKIYCGHVNCGKLSLIRVMLLFYFIQRYKEYRELIKNCRFRFRDLFLIKYLVDLDNFGVYYAKKNS